MLAITSTVLALIIIVTSFYLYWKLDHVPHRTRKTTPARYALDFTSVSVPTSAGKQLFGWYIPCDSTNKRPGIVILHGWGGNASNLLTFAPVLHNNGYNLLFLDASNHGKSDSNSRTSMLQFSQDIDDGLDWLGKQYGVDPESLIVMGHSNAAAGALLLASQRQLQGVIAVSAFPHTVPFLKQWIRTNTRIPYWPIGWLVVHYMQFRLGCKYDKIAPVNTIKDISCPILFVHGENDLLASIPDMQQVLFNATNKQTELFSVSKAGHESLRIFRTNACDKVVKFLHSI